MKTFARLHLYPHSEPQGCATIVADPTALRALSEVCRSALHSMAGMETAIFFGSDGHEYELRVISSVSETEWQQLPLPGIDHKAVQQLSIVKLFDELVDQQNEQLNQSQSHA